MILSTITLPVLLPETTTDPHRNLRNSLCLVFGGFTRVEAFGGWVNDQGDLITERVYQYQIAHADTENARETLVYLARRAGKQGRQSSIYYTIAGEAFIETYTPANAEAA